MKRFWHACFAVIASTAMIGTANAQWNQSPEIGSYQSILARTGYGSSPVGGAVGSIPGALPGAMQGGSGSRNIMPEQLGSGSRNAMPGQLDSGMQHMAPMQSTMAPQGVNAGVSYGAPQASTGCTSCGTGGGAVQYNGGSHDGATMAPAMGQAYADSGSAGSCGSGSYGGPGAYGGSTVVGGGVGNYTDLGAGFASGSCGAPVYTPGANVGGGVGDIVQGARAGGGTNRVAGIFGVALRRNYEDPLRIGANAGRDIFSDDIDNGTMTGIGASLASRKANGNGSELIYWGIDDDTDSNFTSPDFYSVGQVDDLQLDGLSVFDTFNGADSIRVYRDMELNNFEANLLRNGGNYQTRHGRAGNFELLGGFRLFQFDESFRMVANGSGAFAPTTEYALEAQNFLLGGQLGARNEICLTNRLRLSSGVKVGLFNNRSETRQRVFNQAGTLATVDGGPANGRDFDYSDTQDDVAVLGELRLGLIMQVSQKIRANVGYQALGVGGLALAVDQVPLNTLDPGLLQRSRTNQSLLLHGAYFGAQTCF